MILREALQQGTKMLAEQGIADAPVDAWYLLSYVTGLTRSTYYMRDREELAADDEKRYWKLLEKRADRIPLQHLTGEQEFMGLTFQVNEHVLIPRQDTELLVEEALKYSRPERRALDMCTGSGCIALSLALLGAFQEVEAADISREALQVAARNARNLLREYGDGFCKTKEMEGSVRFRTERASDGRKINVTLRESNLFANIEGKFDVLVSNPPYIRTAVIETLEPEVRTHEPMMALDGKEDGLYFYRRIVEEGKAFLNPQGVLLFEIGHDQGAEVSELLREAGYKDIEVKKDLAGLDRVVSGRI